MFARLFVAVFLLLVLAPRPAEAQLYPASVATFIAAHVVDIHSSWGKQELNPLLGRGQFGWKQTSIKAGLAGANLLLQHIALRREPKYKRNMAMANFAMAGMYFGLAAHNYQVQRPSEATGTPSYMIRPQPGGSYEVSQAVLRFLPKEPENINRISSGVGYGRYRGLR